MLTGNIQYLRHTAIDTTKWDRCIETSSNGLIYSLSFFLDHLAPGWEALVYGDYEAVMPLTNSKKYGIPYLFQPLYMKQSGVTGPLVRTELVDAFLQSIPARYKLIDIDLHENNHTEQYAPYASNRVNMLLDLQQGYGAIYEQYHRLARRMINRAKEEAITVEVRENVDECIAFYKEQYEATLGQPAAVFPRINRVFNDACTRGMCLCLAAKKNGKLTGTLILPYDHRAVYSLVGGSSEEGKNAGAFYLLTDHAIQYFAGSNRVFRFEGSDLPGVADFNTRFGASVVHYTHLKINRLPALIRWLK